MAYTAQQIAIIRSKTAGRTTAAAPVAKPAKRTAPLGSSSRRRKDVAKRRTPFGQLPVEHFAFDAPVTFMFVGDQDYSAPVAHVVSGSRQASDLFGLTHVNGLLGEIAEFAVDGVVYASICPFNADIHGQRHLIIASSATDLEVEYGKASDAI
jgi:hypothetical protein